MGQSHSRSKEGDRLDEVIDLFTQTSEQLDELRPRAAAEEEAGMPAVPGSYQSLYAGAYATFKQALQEKDALYACMRARDEGRPLPMPKPTPPFRMPEPAVVEPATPMRGASLPQGLQGRSSTSEEGAHAGGDEGSEGVPLLAAETERLAPGLRRRQGHDGAVGRAI